jgi:hypothetical protein
MAEQQNYQSNIQELSDSYTRYTVSRIIANKKDNLLDMEVPADFSEALLQNNVEVNLYSLADNSLIFSDVVRNVSGSIFTETLQYNDNSLRKLLYIDFAKVPNLNLPSGEYSVTLNFFADEIGAYDNRILKVNRISTSRTEVELKLTDISQQSALEQFATPLIPAEFIKPVLIQIFNQEGADDLVLPTSPIKIDSSSLYQNFASGSGEKLVQYNFDDDDGSRIGINTIMQNVLDDAYPIALKTAEDMIFLSGSTLFTETELSNMVVNAIDIAYDAALDDEAQNPQNYRFDLI